LDGGIQVVVGEVGNLLGAGMRLISIVVCDDHVCVAWQKRIGAVRFHAEEVVAVRAWWRWVGIVWVFVVTTKATNRRVRVGQSKRLINCVVEW